MIGESEFKKKYFTNNFYWINESNCEKLQLVAIEFGCLNPLGEERVIEFHEGFKNLGFRSYAKNNFITRFQKEPFLVHTEKATSYDEMIKEYNNRI